MQNDITDDLDALLTVVPPAIAAAIRAENHGDGYPEDHPHSQELTPVFLRQQVLQPCHGGDPGGNKEGLPEKTGQGQERQGADQGEEDS